MTEIRSEKDQAYWERNQLVAYLSKIFPSWMEKHTESDTFWEDDWRNIVFIQLPEGPMSWHIHDSEMKYFDHLEFKDGDSWDGHTVDQKYKSMRS